MLNANTLFVQPMDRHTRSRQLSARMGWGVVFLPVKASKSESIKARIGLGGPALNRIPGPPPSVPDHQMVRCIGQGSYGEVWLARNAVGTWRAVKVVYRQNFHDSKPYDREFDGIQRYEPISRTNEGLIDVLQIGRNDAAGYFYYVMELADSAAEPDVPSTTAPAPGDSAANQFSVAPRLDPKTYVSKTLSRVLQRRGRLSYEECLTLGLTLNLALGHLHRHGLIHRDVKPSNIIFVNGVPKLADIGLVTDLAGAQSFVGTEGFIPPEGPNSPQADLYALGKVLYEASMGKDRNEFPEPVTKLGLDPESRALMELNAVLVRACAPALKERYRRAEEMNADLALLHNGESVRNKHAVARRLRFMTRVGAATLAVLLLAVVPYSLAIREARRAKASAAAAAVQSKRAQTEAIKSEAVAQFLKDTLKAAEPQVALGRDTKMLRGLLNATAERLDTQFKSLPEVEAELRDTLGQVYHELGEYTKSEEMLRRALHLYRQTIGERNRTFAQCLSQLSLAVSDQGRGDEAEKIQRQALAIRLELSPRDDLEVAESLHALGHILGGENKISESERIFRQAIAIRERLLGHENIRVTESLNGLANALSAQGQSVEAEAIWREGIRINIKLLGDQHPAYLWMLNGVAQALLVQKKFTEAEATARQCVLLETNILGLDHPLVASSLTRLARVLENEGKLSEAKTNLEQALGIWTRRLGNQDPSMSETIGALFDVLLSQHDHAGADRVLEQISVPGDKPNLALLSAGGNYLARTGRWQAAAERFSTIIQLNPADHSAYQALASLYVQLGDVPAYTQLRERILAAFGSVTNDPRIADRMAKSCLMLPCQGTGLEIATNLANAAVTFNASSRNHPWFQLCKGLAEFRIGNFDQSRQWLQKVLDKENEGSSRDVEAYMVLALAEHGLHNPGAAEKAYEHGCKLASRRLHTLASGDIETGWTDWILGHALMREAQQALGLSQQEVSVAPVAP